MTDSGEMRRLIFDAMTSDVIYPGRPGAWRSALPYLLQHAAEHAAEAGRLDEIVTDTEFLVYADPTTLARQLHRVRSSEAQIAASIHRASHACHATATPESRRQILAVDAVRLGAPVWADRLLATSPWRVVWATGGQVSSALAATLSQEAAPTAVTCMSLDGRSTAAVGYDDGRILLWDLATSQIVGKLGGHTQAINAIAVGDESSTQWIGTVSGDGAAKLWDPSLTAPIYTYELDDEAKAIAMTLAKGARLLITGGYDEVATVRDITTQQIVLTYGEHESVISGICTGSLAGEAIALTTSNDGTAHVWNVTSGETITTYTGHRSPSSEGGSSWVLDGAVSRLGNIDVGITAGNDGTAHVWDLATGETLHKYAGHHRSAESDGVRLLGVSATRIGGRSTAITSANNGRLHVWDVSSGETHAVLAGHAGSVRSVDTTALRGGPAAVSAGADGTARVWDLGVETERDLDRSVAGHAGMVLALATSPAAPSLVVSTSDDRTARVWEASTGEAVAGLVGHGASVRAASISKQSDVVLVTTASLDRTVSTWDLSNESAPAERVDLGGGYDNAVSAIASAVLPEVPACAVLANSEGVEVWDLDQRQLWARGGPFHTTAVNAMAHVYVENNVLAVSVGDDATIQIFSPTTCKSYRSITGHSGPVLSVDCATNGTTPTAVTGGEDGKVLSHDLSENGQSRTLTTYKTPVTAVALMPAGEHTIVFSASGNIVRASDLTSGRELSDFAFPSPVRALCASSSGTLVVAAGYEVIGMTLTDPGLAPSPREDAK